MELNDEVVEVPETDQEEETAEEYLNGNEPSKDEGNSTAANTSMAKEKESDEDIKPWITGKKERDL